MLLRTGMQQEVLMRHARHRQSMARRRRSPLPFPVLLVLIVLAALIGGILGLAALTPRWLQAEAAPQTFVFTETPQMYVVPDDVTSITVTAKGAQGNTVTGGGTGGLGGTVTATSQPVSLRPPPLRDLLQRCSSMGSASP